MKLTYSLSRTYRERVFIETGAEVDPFAFVELPADALTPELRAHIVRVRRTPGVPSEFSLVARYNLGYDAMNLIGDGALTLDGPATDDDALRLLTEDAARWDAAEATRVVRAAELAAERERRKAEDAARREREQAAARAEAAERERRDAEKREWIAAHGSAYLKKCLAGGYDCQRRYAIERAAAEHPGYTLDYNDAASWRDRAGPSEAALDEAARAGGTVVWLTAPPSNAVPSRDDDHDDDRFESREAVVIRGFLGKYDLVKQF